MRYLFILNPAAGRTDCTERLRLQAEGALRRAGIPQADWDIRRTEYRYQRIYGRCYPRSICFQPL